MEVRGGERGQGGQASGGGGNVKINSQQRK